MDQDLLPNCQTSFVSIGLSVQEKFNIDFQDGAYHLGFPIRMILATFHLQVYCVGV